MDEDRRRRDEPGDEDAGRRAEGGMSYTARPSRERPEDGEPTRDEDQERSDSPEGREQT